MSRWFSLFCLFALVGIPVSASAEASVLPQSVYVWQRAWTAPVVDAVTSHGTNFSEVVVLQAEISWRDGLPQVTRVAVDFSALAKAHCRVGLALRIGPCKGALSHNKTAINVLADLAASLVAEARQHQVEPCELQIDFDCATAQLADYRAWLLILQQRLSPLPVIITALPSWLDSPAFARLAAVSSNYVLQVHSLQKPTSINRPFQLCDPVVARQAVNRAGEIGVPFRVALPTYAYLVAFNSSGDFIGLSAEAPKSSWSPETQIREMAADPLAISTLVQTWSQPGRPAALRGLIWYRLPTDVDKLNWRWPTLGAIVAARVPQASFHAIAHRVEAGLVEIRLVNDGELDISSRLAVEAHWSDARFMAGDGLCGFELAESDDSAAQFQNRSFRLRAGESQVIGWLRLDQSREVQLEIKKF